MIKTQLADGYGTGKHARVSGEGAIYVTHVDADIPEQGTPSRRRFYADIMHAADDVAVTDMAINGSSTPRYYEFTPNARADIFIMAITIIVADGSVSHNKWGGLNKLSNGWSLWVEEQGNRVDIVTEAKTGGELLAQSAFYGMYGNGSTSNELSNWSGSSDAQTVHIPIGQ